MAKDPYSAIISIDALKVDAFSTLSGISAVSDGTGMPLMGSMASTFEFSIDVHNQDVIPFTTVKTLFELCNQPTKDKIKDIKIEYWKNDEHDGAIISLAFKGWISSWTISSGGGSNHILSITLQPQLDKSQYLNVQIGN